MNRFWGNKIGDNIKRSHEIHSSRLGKIETIWNNDVWTKLAGYLFCELDLWRKMAVFIPKYISCRFESWSKDFALLASLDNPILFHHRPKCHRILTISYFLSYSPTLSIAINIIIIISGKLNRFEIISFEPN